LIFSSVVEVDSFDKMDDEDGYGVDQNGREGDKKIEENDFEESEEKRSSDEESVVSETLAQYSAVVLSGPQYRRYVLSVLELLLGSATVNEWVDNG